MPPMGAPKVDIANSATCQDSLSRWEGTCRSSPDLSTAAWRQHPAVKKLARASEPSTFQAAGHLRVIILLHPRDVT